MKATRSPGDGVGISRLIAKGTKREQRTFTLQWITNSRCSLFPFPFTPAAGWSSTVPAFGSGGTVSAWGGSLAAGASAHFTLVVQINSGTASCTVISNTASVGPLAGDPNPDNIHITLNTNVVQSGPVNISSDVRLARSGFRYDLGRHEFVQTITITNISGGVLVGPLALQLVNLSSNAALANASGHDANGNPYVDFVSSSGQLAAGQSLTVMLYFKAPTFKAISYDTQVWQGI